MVNLDKAPVFAFPGMGVAGVAAGGSVDLSCRRSIDAAVYRFEEPVWLQFADAD